VYVGPGHYDVAPEAATLPGPEGYPTMTGGIFSCRGFNTVAGAGWSTVFREHARWTIVAPDCLGQAQPLISNINIRDFQVLGTPGLASTGGGVAVHLGNAHNAFVERVYFSAIHGIGVCMGGAGGHPAIIGPGNNQWTSRCLFQGGGPDDWGAGGVAIALVNVRNAHVEGNTLTRGGGAGLIDIEQNNDTDKCEGFSIRDNIIDTRRSLVGYDEWPEQIYDSPESVYPDDRAVFPQCLILHGKDGGITGPGKVSGNQIYGGWLKPGYYDGVHPQTAVGLFMQGKTLHSVDVENNHFYNGNGPAIAVDGHHNNVRGNTIHNWGSGIPILIRGRHCVVEQNTVQYFGWAPNDVAILESAAHGTWTDYNVVKGNHFGWSHRPPGADPQHICPHIALVGPHSREHSNDIPQCDPQEANDPNS
jgi:hypothetical protein